ncbi:aminopeptidase [Sulfuriflexus mobilis]|uniref:aminopeptidase n=1 Tax=Sulfuriflexus mobilis TaxID=1811807 RepID=UPI000F829FDB|nr:aminopeptidase [Sulfuriflexus mobilis]
MRPAYLLLLALSILLGGCAELAYYGHAAAGQLEVINNRRPIPEVIADPQTPAAVRERLQYIERAHAFAIRALHLPDSESYRSYSDVSRPYVLWNVFATPALSLQQKQWCYPFFGCQGYRAFFNEAYAQELAAELQAQGWDVYVAPSPAYSTRGWFADPIYNPVLRYPAIDSAAILFHELAHEKIYLKDDSQANESFAMTVQLEGVRRWLMEQQQAEYFDAYNKNIRRDETFVLLLMGYRKNLEELYASENTTRYKRAEKRRILNQLHRAYLTLKESWKGYAGYDHWFTKKLNNAVLAPVGTYHQDVPLFQALLEQHQGDLPAFYKAVEELAQMDAARRRQELNALLPD